MLRATTACTFSTSQLPKVVRSWCVLYILTWKCDSRHNGVHFFDISTSKSGPRPSVFNTFDFEMCFAPQRRALFRHRNVQKWSGAGVFCTFSLGNGMSFLVTFTVLYGWRLCWDVTRWCPSRGFVGDVILDPLRANPYGSLRRFLLFVQHHCTKWLKRGRNPYEKEQVPLNFPINWRSAMNLIVWGGVGDFKPFLWIRASSP